MIYGIIYVATNLLNNKRYVGQTTGSLNRRISSHLSNTSSDNYFHSSLKEYGYENFKWEIVDAVENKNQLDVSEQYYINFYDTTNNDKGYNSTTGGINFIHVEETLKKIREKTIGKIISDETRKKISEANLGKHSGPKSELTKMKISAANKGKKRSDETKEKMSKSHTGDKNYNYGKHLSEKTKDKLRKKLSGDKNPMFGRTPYDIWIEKYGKDEADKKLEAYKSKLKKNNSTASNVGFTDAA